MSNSRTHKLRRTLVVAHRWTALILGLLMVVVSTSGALIVYEPELLRAGNAEMFHSTPADQPVGFGAAIEAVQAADGSNGAAPRLHPSRAKRDWSGAGRPPPGR